MKSKAEKLRDLLGHAVEILDEQHSIENITEQVVLEKEVCGKRSIILCCPIAFDELQISVWWGYKPQEIPEDANSKEPTSTLPKNEIVDAMVSGWIERKTGLWIQGKGTEGLFNAYCSRDARQELEVIPKYESAKIKRTGQFYN